MTSYVWRKSYFFIIAVIYSSLFYAIATQCLRLDFSSIYSAILAVNQGLDPFQVLQTSYFATVKKLSANLNPPIVLVLFTPLTWLRYNSAVIVWTVVSFLLGLASAIISFKIAFAQKLDKNKWFILILCYLMMFSTLVSLAIAQLGALLSFIIILGYYCYLKEKDFSSACCWALACSIKFFPGLLLFFALSRKRYRLSLYFIAIVTLLLLVPYLLYGNKVYYQYMHMLPRVMWYGDSWNASFIGLLYRLIIDSSNPHQPLMLVKSLSAIVFCIGLGWYLFKNHQFANDGVPHRQFSFTITMMLLLSPLGWMYYFSLLVFPLCISWLSIKDNDIPRLILWLTSLFLLNFPVDYINAFSMLNLFTIVTIDSVFLYGLLLLTYLLCKSEPSINYSIQKQKHSFTSMIIILSFGLIVFAIGIAIRLYQGPLF